MFIDRDGTLIKEPADEQIDAFEKLEFVPGVMRNLAFIRQKLDYEFVMVSNQDGLGTDAFLEDTFWPVHNLMMRTLEGEGVTFDDVLIDRSFPEENLPTRKPGTAMLGRYTSGGYDMEACWVIGDRETDAQLALNLGCRALILKEKDEDSFSDERIRYVDSWDRIAEILLPENVKPVCAARPRRPTSRYAWIWTAAAGVISVRDWDSSTTCWSKSASMAEWICISARKGTCRWTNTTR